MLDGNSGFSCADPNIIEYKAWGECGLMKVCINKDTGEKDGSQFAAQSGRIQSKTFYSNGLRSSSWTWFDANGNAVHENGGYRTPGASEIAAP